MAHCGYEPTAAMDAVKNPFKALKVALRGPRTDGPMAPEIPLDKQRPAEYVFEDLVAEAMTNSDRRAAEERARSKGEGANQQAAQ